MRELATFGVDDLVELSKAFDAVTDGATSMERAAQRVVEHLEADLAADGRPAVCLARLYKTHRYGELDPELRAFADELAVHDLDPRTPCLTLLATAGVLPAWNDRRSSQGHRAIPLTGAAALERSPMIAALFRELGVDVEDVLAADGTRSAHHRSYDVFFVPDAVGSPRIPAQDDFVVPHGIRSVLGIGGFLPSGDLFALVLFLRASITEEVAELFRTVALSLKAVLVPFTYRVFEGESKA